VHDLIHRNLRHFWHPCAQMKDYETFTPIIIKQANGSYFTLQDDRKVIDAISSWWCKSLGHNHPRLRQALVDQSHKFEHVLLANTTHEVIVNLSERLGTLLPNLTRVSYASDGSCAIEMAIKMSMHSRLHSNEPKRTAFAALRNGYHGETLGALAVSDLGLYRKPYEPLMPQINFIDHIPYVNGPLDPLWHDCSSKWPKILEQLTPLADKLTAIIVEPIVQGAGGMLIYSQDFLRRLRQWTLQQGIHLIADEIMTSLGRTGLPLACQHADILPDFLCLGKNLTAGWLPLSAVITTDTIYQLFYDDYASGKSFLHSHTYSGNALAAAVAVECLKIYEDEGIYEHVKSLAINLKQSMQKVSEETGRLKNIRAIGGIVAADLIVEDERERAGYAVYQRAVQLGAFLRPLGNTIYWLPPLNCSKETIVELEEITIKAILV
jgi:adenosylmethionine-8-amino-7-oxononanoate aminotransferase